ncbi:MAG: hypothetical protein ACE5H7_14010 [Acidiferrobacterales bacterium]
MPKTPLDDGLKWLNHIMKQLEPLEKARDAMTELATTWDKVNLAKADLESLNAKRNTAKEAYDRTLHDLEEKRIQAEAYLTETTNHIKADLKQLESQRDERKAKFKAESEKLEQQMSAKHNQHKQDVEKLANDYKAKKASLENELVALYDEKHQLTGKLAELKAEWDRLAQFVSKR